MTATEQPPGTPSSTRLSTTRTLTVTWLVLVAITAGSWWLAPGHSGPAIGPSVPVTALVLVLALVKCRMIIRVFMEVRVAPRWLRLSTDAWLVILFLTIFAIYLI